MFGFDYDDEEEGEQGTFEIRLWNDRLWLWFLYSFFEFM